MAAISYEQTVAIKTWIFDRIVGVGYFEYKVMWPGVIKISAKMPVDDPRNKEIDDIIWDEFGCYQYTVQISKDVDTGRQIKVHWYWFDDGESRGDTFNDDMRAFLIMPLGYDSGDDYDYKGDCRMRKDKVYWFDLGNGKKAMLQFEVDKWFTAVVEGGISWDNYFDTEVEALREILCYCEVEE